MRRTPSSTWPARCRASCSTAASHASPSAACRPAPWRRHVLAPTCSSSTLTSIRPPMRPPRRRPTPRVSCAWCALQSRCWCRLSDDEIRSLLGEDDLDTGNLQASSSDFTQKHIDINGEPTFRKRKMFVRVAPDLRMWVPTSAHELFKFGDTPAGIDG